MIMRTRITSNRPATLNTYRMLTICGMAAATRFPVICLLVKLIYLYAENESSWLPLRGLDPPGGFEQTAGGCSVTVCRSADYPNSDSEKYTFLSAVPCPKPEDPIPELKVISHSPSCAASTTNNTSIMHAVFIILAWHV